MNVFEDEQNYVRSRSQTWSYNQQRRTSAPSNKWGDDFELNSSIMRHQILDDSPFEPIDDRSAPVAASHTQTTNGGKKKRKSYTEIIATAILNSPEKRLTLAEIYDWMAANCDEYKNQRYVPSSSSWKNAVRHNLSVQACFKRVKRHGVEKPSWWTVDMRQAAKRRLSVPLVMATNGKTELTPEFRTPQKRTQMTTMSEETGANHGSGVYLDGLAEDDEGESDEHAYSRNFQFTNGEDPASKMHFESMVTYDGQNGLNVIEQQTIVALDTQTSLEPVSADQLAQMWLKRFGIPGTLVTNKDGSPTVQTLRVKTIHGVEQNVRFMGPLRVNVLVRCEKASQTDDLMDSNAIGCLDYQFEALSRTCSIDQTLINLGNESMTDVSKILHSGDVKMRSAMNVLSPAEVSDEDVLAACWNSANFNTDDLMTFANLS